QALCRGRGCCWSPHSESGPWCFFPRGHGYRLNGPLRPSPQGFEGTLERLPSPQLFGKDLPTVLLTGEYQTPTRFRFKLTDPESRRFEVPHQHVRPFSGPAASNLKYKVDI
ncbi:MGA protein, partial [Himantopus himantopus]|nr:MGA protein [Himantopus himantopus]